MTDTSRASPNGIARRDFMLAGAGAATLVAGLSAASPAFAQAGPGPAAPPPLSAKPGNVLVERRGGVLLIGIDRPEAQNVLDPPILLGLGKAYYQLEHENDLRVGSCTASVRISRSAST
jgi:enoyl-CoA hydratase